jgi:alpha-beta hydrolase superfamily lysophospholipase
VSSAFRSLLAAALVLGAAVDLFPQVHSQRVSFRTTDGVTIAASFYEATKRPAPAVICLHMLTRSRRDWEPVAAELASAGIAVLTIDFRGHGESGVAPSDAAAGLASFTQDAAAAKRYLESRPDVMRDRIAIAGASLGAEVALVTAAADPAIRAVALLSPTMDYRGLRIDQAAKKYGARPMLLVASREDSYSLRTIRDLTKTDQPGNPREKVLVDTGHGTMMFSRDTGLIRTLVDWFQRALR